MLNFFPKSGVHVLILTALQDYFLNWSLICLCLSLIVPSIPWVSLYSLLSLASSKTLFLTQNPQALNQAICHHLNVATPVSLFSSSTDFISPHSLKVWALASWSSCLPHLSYPWGQLIRLPAVISVLSLGQMTGGGAKDKRERKCSLKKVRLQLHPKLCMILL